MADVAREAGVAKGTVFHRFGDRQGLAQALVDDAERALQDELLRGPPPLGPGAPPSSASSPFSTRCSRSDRAPRPAAGGRGGRAGRPSSHRRLPGVATARGDAARPELGVDGASRRDGRCRPRPGSGAELYRHLRGPRGLDAPAGPRRRPRWRQGGGRDEARRRRCARGRQASARRCRRTGRRSSPRWGVGAPAAAAASRRRASSTSRSTGSPASTSRSPTLAGYRRACEALLATGVTAFQPTFITAPEVDLVAALRAMPAEPLRPARHRRAPRGAVAVALAAGRPRRRAPSRGRPALLRRLLAAGQVCQDAPRPRFRERRAHRRVGGAGRHRLPRPHRSRRRQRAPAFDRGARTVTHLFNAMRPRAPRDPASPSPPSGART